MSAQRLMVNLALYFVLLFGGILAVLLIWPDSLSMMPFGGMDAIDIAGIEPNDQSLTSLTGRSTSAGDAAVRQAPTARQIGLVSIFLATSLGGTILVMLPITWTYAATKREIGYRKNFARALFVLPICAATIVLLIQNNLALAFGLAAMVAAVRFRVALQEAIDGIYIFSSIYVGLAAGIGYLGIAAIMAVFFCFTNAVLWGIQFGQNPIDDARIARKHDNQEGEAALTGAPQQLPRD
jgi:hypothetical protein